MADVTSQDNLEDLLEHWPLDVVDPHDETVLHGILETIVTELRKVDVAIEEVYDDRFIFTATGRELEKLGALVDCDRRTDEGDSAYRSRILATFGAKASTTTIDSFGGILLSILDTDAGSVIVERPPTSPPATVNVMVESEDLEESAITAQDLVDLLDQSVAAGHTVQATVLGTFAFDGDDSSLEGFDEGTWSSRI